MERRNSSLTVANDIENSDGMQYSLVSKVPAFSVEQLRASSTEVPADIAARYLGLPLDLTPQVRERAIALTQDQTTVYDKMRALQDHFRGYDYNVRLGPREGDPIEQFLAERQGFCQQFAGTMALMARALGVPARVATGFTWGDPVGVDEATGKTIYRVTGRQTHAWPEIYFHDLGWVAFEPTPGRGLPGAESYTNVPATQDSDIQPNNPGGPTTTTTTDPSLGGGPTVEPNFEDFNDPGFVEPATAPTEGFQVPWRLVLVLALAALYGVGMPLVWQLRRQSRRNNADTPARRVETAWAEAVEALELGFDLQRQPAETRTEYARRLEADRRVPSEDFDQLAEAATIARFHPDGVTDLRADQADHLAARIETSMRNRVPVYTRFRRQLDPRRLLNRHRVSGESFSPLPRSHAEVERPREPVAAGRP